MPRVTKQQIAKAKEWDLLSYLMVHEPEELKKSGPEEYRTKTHDSLVINNGKWHWFSRNIGGRSALDYLIKVRGEDFITAVDHLCQGTPSPSLFQPVEKKENREEVKKPFLLPEAASSVSRVRSYLKSRGIHEEVIGSCIRVGTLYESKKHHNCVFVGKDENNKARFASLRGTASHFKLDISGSDKRYGFHIPAESKDCSLLEVFESPIDAMSGASIKLFLGENYKDRHYLSLSGTAPLALLHFLKKNPQVQSVVLCLDNDEAGIMGMEKIRKCIQEDPSLSRQVLTLIHKPCPKECGKDYNLYLQKLLSKGKNEIQKTMERSMER